MLDTRSMLPFVRADKQLQRLTQKESDGKRSVDVRQSGIALIRTSYKVPKKENE